MNLPGYSVRIIVILLFFSAIGARFASVSGSVYPYFKGSSAMNYRDATIVAGGGNLGELTKKSNWPEGYEPSRVHATGAEHLTGYSLRVAQYLSEIEARKFIKRFFIIFFAITVFSAYGIVASLWRCQAAGLFAAALVAFFYPAIEATNGREFNHLPIAVVVATFHVLFLLVAAKKRTIAAAVLSAVFLFFLFALWELAPYFAVIVSLSLAFHPRVEANTKRRLCVVSAVVFLAAAAWLPYLQAIRVAFSWQFACVAACCACTFLPQRHIRGIRGPLLVLAGTVVLLLVLAPFRAGAEQNLPGLKYVFYRLRFLLGKPADPNLLPPDIRQLWSAQHAPPNAYAVLQFLFPLLFFVPSILLSVREAARDQVLRGRLMWCAAIGGAGLIMYLIDRSSLLLAFFAVLPAVALALREPGHLAKQRVIPVVLGALLILVQLLAPVGSVNATYQIAKNLGVAHRDKSAFLWVSLENTDRELVRFVATRTSVSDPVLGRPDITAILLTFSGRTSVLLSGAWAEGFAKRRVGLTRLFYGDEDRLYNTCNDLGIKYVLYSIDYLLNPTTYSPSYLSGEAVISGDCAAFKMHFSPESLANFNLVYENDHYRLFRVTNQIEPVFVTDHPPVYQRDLLNRHSGDFESFYDNVIALMVTYSDAVNSHTRGDFQDAVGKLKWCVGQAPRFTTARIALGTALLGLGQIQEARDMMLSVVGYAPDNPLALFYTAYTMAQLDQRDRAMSYLELLYTATNDSDLLERADLLQDFLKQENPAKVDSSTTK